MGSSLTRDRTGHSGHRRVDALVLFILAIFLVPIVVTAQNPVQADVQPTPLFKAFINNNPAYRGEMIHGSRVESTPSIRIEGTRVPADGTLLVSVHGDGNQVLFRGKRQVRVENDSLAVDFPLQAPLKGPKFTRVTYQSLRYAAEVTARLNGKAVALRQIVEVPDFIGPGEDDWRPACVVSFGLGSVLEARKETGPVVVAMRAVDKHADSWGEAYLVNPEID